MSNQKSTRVTKSKATSRSTSSDPYLEFVKTVSLGGMGLDSCACIIDRQAMVRAEQDGVAQNRRLSAHTTVSNHSDESFSVQASYDLLISSSTDNSGDIAKISCVFSALFGLRHKASADLVKRFTDNEVRLIFWPYLRHFVLDISYRMTINPILLPLTSELPAPENNNAASSTE